MSDPFSRKHAADHAANTQKDRTQAQKQAANQISQRVAAQEAAAKRGPNDDLGYRWRPKFYEPGG